MKQIERNIKVFRWYYFFWRFKPLTALMIIYFAEITNSYALSSAIFSMTGIAYALIKIPAGFLSDKIGRKKVIVLGSLILALAFGLLALAGEYQIIWLLFLFAFLWGSGDALISGTTDALMYETVEEMKQKQFFKDVYAKSMLSDQIGCILAALIATVASLYCPIQYLAWLTALLTIFLLITALCFIEPSHRLKKSKIGQKYISSALKQFMTNKKLCFYAAMDIFFSTMGDISHRFEGAYFKLFTSDWVISLAKMLKHLWGIIGFASVAYIKNFDQRKIYFGSISINLLIRSLALIANNILSPFIHMVINFFYATAATAKTDILQQEFLPQYRAAMQSIVLFTKSLFMALMMYLLGIFADSYGVFSAMIALIVLRIIGLISAFLWHKLLFIKT